MKTSSLHHVVFFILAASGLLLMTGCTTPNDQKSETVSRLNVEPTFSQPPTNYTKSLLGVPAFGIGEKMQAEGADSREKLEQIAADQLVTLAVDCGRFNVIERARLQNLLQEQHLNGVVKEGQLASPGKIRGVDYLLLGRVTHLSVKAQKSGFSLGLSGASIPGIGPFDFKDKRSKISTECEVEMHLVDPVTGSIMAATTGMFRETNSISGFGIAVKGVNAGTDSTLQISEEDNTKLLRQALGDGLLKMMPQIDRLPPPTPIPPPKRGFFAWIAGLFK